MTKPKRDRAKEKLLANRPEPTDKEAGAIAAASSRVVARRDDPSRPRVPKSKVGYLGPNSVLVASAHSDDTGWAAQMSDALGSADGRVIDFLQTTACQASTAAGKINSQADADKLQRDTDEALAFAAENSPANPIEAAILVQMAAVHRVSMAMAAATLTATRYDRQADAVKQMNQTMRTFAAQAEALNKLRTGGKQVHEVRYVYVDARTQTVVNNGGGSGGALPDLQQPHAPFGGALGYAPPQGLPVWGDDASGDALPVASDQGQAPLPDARRQESGRTTRRRERQLPGGPLDATDHPRPRSGPRPRQALSGDAA